MKELRFQGFSDDVFAIIAPKEFSQEVDCPRGGGGIRLYSDCHKCGIVVYGIFTNEGWALSIRVDHGHSNSGATLFWYSWRVVKGDYEHSPILIVECPDDVTVTSNQPDDE